MAEETVASPASALSSAPSDLEIMILRIEAEKRVEDYKAEDAKDNTKKLLLPIIRLLPDDGAMIICKEIVQCESNAKIRDTYQYLFRGLILPMKAKSHTPSPVLSPRKGAIDSLNEIVSELPDPATRQQTMLRKFCLLRDNNRCMISGVYDYNRGLLLTTAEIESLKREGTTRYGTLEAAHIVPFSMASYSTPSLHEASIIWEALYRCFPRLQAIISPNKINDTSNVLMLRSELHTLFRKFSFALKPIEQANVYEIHTYVPFPLGDLPEGGLVTFKAHDPAYELPSPVLLEAHWCVAEILHASGMGRYIERMLEDREEISAFAEDGSTDVGRLLLVY